MIKIPVQIFCIISIYFLLPLDVNACCHTVTQTAKNIECATLHQDHINVQCQYQQQAKFQVEQEQANMNFLQPIPDIASFLTINKQAQLLLDCSSSLCNTENISRITKATYTKTNELHQVMAIRSSNCCLCENIILSNSYIQLECSHIFDLACFKKNISLSNDFAGKAPSLCSICMPAEPSYFNAPQLTYVELCQYATTNCLYCQQPIGYKNLIHLNCSRCNLLLHKDCAYLSFIANKKTTCVACKNILPSDYIGVIIPNILDKQPKNSQKTYSNDLKAVSHQPTFPKTVSQEIYQPKTAHPRKNNKSQSDHAYINCGNKTQPPKYKQPSRSKLMLLSKLTLTGLLGFTTAVIHKKLMHHKKTILTHDQAFAYTSLLFANGSLLHTMAKNEIKDHPLLTAACWLSGFTSNFLLT